jgi:HJR/Mrr/RecB family endonuclease
MSQKHTLNWETFLDLLLRQAGMRPPRSFWDLLHLLQKNLSKDINGSYQGKPLRQLSGPQFEQFLGWFFEQQDYNVTRMKSSHDKGGDLIIERARERTVIQAKRRKKTIGVQAIQECFTAKAYYKANHALVITTSKISRPAVDLAHRLEVEIWDRERLLQELRTHQQPPPMNQDQPAQEKS